MKKLIKTVLSIAVFVATIFCFLLVANASTPNGTQLKTSGIYYRFDSSSKTLILSGEGDMPNLSYSTADIPWLDSVWDIQKVVVESGITSISNYAFYQMDVEISLPNTITKIGQYSFASNQVLTSVEMPKVLNSIGSYAFYNCKNLANIDFVDKNQSIKIGSNAFYKFPSLLNVCIPKEATLSSNCFGYSSYGVKNEGFSMGVYKDSGAHYYAVSNGLDFYFLGGIDLQCGVPYKNSFSSDNINDEVYYSFTPDKSQSYVFYSSGECDVMARLEKSGVEIESSNDIDQSNSGFCIRVNLQAGVSYDLVVSSEKMTGDYNVVVYPNELTGFSVLNGKVYKNALNFKVYDNKKVFVISNDDISSFELKIDFADGTSYELPYSRYIAGRYVTVLDTVESQQKNGFSCGENMARLGLGDLVATYSLNIEHSYTEKVVAPTVDDDGYTLHTCVLCGESFKSDFVKTTSYKVVGTCYLSEHPILDTYESKTTYHSAVIVVDKREYKINQDGTFEFRTFDDCYAVFKNSYGGNKTKKVDISNAVDGVIDIGDIVLSGYDLNSDGYVNAKDYVIYNREKKDDLGENYWQFAYEFLSIS